MDVVFSETPELIPPKTPAIHNGLDSASQIIISSECNSLSTSSKVVNLVP